MTTWGAFAAAEPKLATFVAERLQAAPSYLATVREDGVPRVPDRYVLFELRPTEARGKGYGDVVLPERQRWRAQP